MEMAAFQLLRLASPALPIGAYSYSQGMESAIEHAVVRDSVTARIWIADQLDGPVGRWEAPLLWHSLLAAEQEDWAQLDGLNQRWLASRETRELRAETEQTGYSLIQLLKALDAGELPLAGSVGLLAAWALAARHWNIYPQAALQAYLWSWLENQVMVLMKALPMGQVAGQKLLGELLPELEVATQRAQSLPQADLSGFAPALAWLSARHETQYSRLFRS
ncbi:MAG: urease accessory UreF family protein [Formivibrio sp.]|nr:urease accessory UreF family protein [Formivibrio sp.]